MKLKLSILWLASVIGAFYLGASTTQNVKSISNVKQETLKSPESSLEEQLMSEVKTTTRFKSSWLMRWPKPK